MEADDSHLRLVDSRRPLLLDAGLPQLVDDRCLLLLDALPGSGLWLVARPLLPCRQPPRSAASVLNSIIQLSVELWTAYLSQNVLLK